MPAKRLSVVHRCQQENGMSTFQDSKMPPDRPRQKILERSEANFEAVPSQASQPPMSRQIMNIYYVSFLKTGDVWGWTNITH